MPDAAVFLTAAELAAIVRASAWWIKAQARRTGPNVLPSYKAGKRVVFDRNEALEWFARTRRRAPAPPIPRRRSRRQRRDAGRPRAEVQP